MQNHRLFIHANHWFLRIVGPFAYFQQLFYPLDVLRVEFRNAPHFFRYGSKSWSWSKIRTVSRPNYWNQLALQRSLANQATLRRAWPAGGSPQTRAIMLSRPNIQQPSLARPLLVIQCPFQSSRTVTVRQLSHCFARQLNDPAASEALRPSPVCRRGKARKLTRTWSTPLASNLSNSCLSSHSQTVASLVEPCLSVLLINPNFRPNKDLFYAVTVLGWLPINVR
jgi:hypothetical protein